MPETNSGQKESLYPLLDYLAQNNHPMNGPWQGWQITKIEGGFNNLLYRASGSVGDFAIKFTIRDQRDRAGREYGALLALQMANLPIAPQPILLERHRYAQPVVVQSWLEGNVLTSPPISDTEWEDLLKHYARVHTLTPDKVEIELPGAALDIRNVEAGRVRIWYEVDCIPDEAQPASLQVLLDRFEREVSLDSQTVSLALCRVDSNHQNFIQQPGGIVSVDWENSGWSDPAFEIAELMTHPVYMDVPLARWDWVMDTYCKLTDNPATAKRIRDYYRIMLVWWVARLARFLYEVPRGLDQRLVSQPDGWQAKKQIQYEHYLRLAEMML